jgi:hypothetical protein
VDGMIEEEKQSNWFWNFGVEKVLKNSFGKKSGDYY